MKDNIARLERMFEDPKYRELPLSKRNPITELLEETLFQVIDLVRPDLFLEVGAFEAGFSSAMKSKYPNVRAVALEANPRVYRHFAETAQSVGVEYLNYAASSERGTVEIHIPEVIAGKEMPVVGRMGSLLQVGLRDSRTVAESVEAVPIDDLLRNDNFSKCCAWIDVEGLLSEVLSGAGETLQKCDVLYTEMEVAPVWKGQVLARENLERLQDIGFRLVARDCQKWFQYNALFIRQELVNQYRLQPIFDIFTDEALGLFGGGEVSPEGE